MGSCWPTLSNSVARCRVDGRLLADALQYRMLFYGRLLADALQFGRALSESMGSCWPALCNTVFHLMLLAAGRRSANDVMSVDMNVDAL